MSALIGREPLAPAGVSAVELVVGSVEPKQVGVRCRLDNVTRHYVSDSSVPVIVASVVDYTVLHGLRE